MKKRQKRVALRKINASLNSSMLAIAYTKSRANITAVTETPLGDPGVDRKNVLSAPRMIRGRKLRFAGRLLAHWILQIKMGIKVNINFNSLLFISHIRGLFSKFS